MKLLIPFFIFYFSHTLKAQEQPIREQWTASFHVGPTIGGQGNQISRVMTAAGFRYQPGWLNIFGRTKMAVQDPLLQFRIERLTHRQLSYSLLFSYLSGNLKGFSPKFEDLVIDHAQATLSFLFGYFTKDGILRLAAGPSINLISRTPRIYSSVLTPVKESNFAIGLALEAGLRFPAKSRIFCDLNTQFHLMGKQDLGTYRFANGDFKIGNHTINHLSFNFGLGVRFGKLHKEKLIRN